MARTNKNFNNKKAELSSQIFNLFLKNGYENTSLATIINSLNISKGSFYHYFESKENCLDYAINKYISDNIIYLNNILLEKTHCNAEEKFHLLLTQGLNKHTEAETYLENIHTPSNTILHQKLLIQKTKKFAPIFSEIIIQGINEGSFKTNYPLEVAETILSISNFLLNIDLFHWNEDEFKTRIKVLEDTITLLLHAKPNTFSYITNFN